MSPRRLLAIARKETLHVLRDARSLAIALALPVLLLTLYGYALTLDVDRVPMVVWDQSQTAASREYISRFEASRYFRIQGYRENYRGMEDALDRRDALVALVVPLEFGRDLEAGRAALAQLIVDGSDANTATLAMGYAEVVTFLFSQNVILEQARQRSGRTLSLPVDFRPRVWFNTELESKNYIIPGLIAVIMMVIAALLTSLTVAREWETGTMEQLISTPVRPTELILGKLMPYMALGMVDVAIAVVMGVYLFDVPLRGSAGLLFGMAAVFLVGALSLGMTISIVTRSQMLASQAALVATFLPSFLLSGFIFAIGNMPVVIQWFTYLVPARYFITLLKGIYLKGVGLEILGAQALLLALFSLGVLAVAHLKFKKKLV